MSKTSWRTKAMYLVFALALVFGLCLTAALPATQVAEASIPNPGTFTISGGNITLDDTVVGWYEDTGENAGNISGWFTGTSVGIPTGDYFVWVGFLLDPFTPLEPGDDTVGGFMVKVHMNNAIGTNDRIDFLGVYATEDGLLSGSYLVPASATPITTGTGGELTGAFTLTNLGTMVFGGYIGVPEIMPPIALDVKGATQKFILVNLPLMDVTAPAEPVFWAVMEQRIAEMANVDNLSEAYPQQHPVSGSGPLSYPEELPETLAWVQTLRNDAQILWWDYALGVALTDQNVLVPDGGEPGDPFIEIYSRAPGDLAVFARLNWAAEGGGEYEITLANAEKKWGVLSHTVLDLNPEYPETPEDADYNWAGAAGTTEEPEIEFFSDFVYAWFFWGEGVPTPIRVDRAGHAIVHWWLIEDDEDGYNEQDILDIMDYLAQDPGCHTDCASCPDECPGCGRYAPSPAPSPFEMINAVWTLNKAQHTTFTNLEDGYYYLAKSTDNTYIETVTQDDFPGETRGLSMVTVQNVSASYGESEDILVVTLTEYPDEFNGENPVCVELGKKSYGVPPPPEYVKTPQLAWAGQKVVLEQNWSSVIQCGTEYTAIYHLESQSVGEIAMGGDNDSSDYAANAVYVHVNCTNPTSEAIIESEVQGEADINVKVYEGGWFGPPVAEPIINYGFLVYFMAFEDVVVAETVTPSDSFSNVNANESVPVAVQVRGWFKSGELPGTTRPPRDVNGDGIYDMPAGRYVMPDDWWALAGNDFEYRPNWDLMDSPDDNITSLYELGPFDSGVRTLDPPGEAEEPCIGPFNTLQLWSTEMMWVALATVPTSHPLYLWRNTVVPDGEMDKWDAPMPQALVNFKVIDATATDPSLSELDKGDLEGYGYIGSEYQSPFYEVEIPSSPFIPSNDYNWHSWDGDWPYDYWEDLMIKSLNDDEPGVENVLDIETYCDNHGIAAMVVDGENAGQITVQATAEYPAAFKKGKYPPIKSPEIPINWGAIELNPHFQANKMDVDVEEVVTFTNLTTAGKTPYTKAEWDFDNDGVFDKTITGTHAQVMADVTWAYEEEGVYTVKLEMTDSAPTTRYEIRFDYIVVGGATPVKIWDLPYGLDEDAGAINLYSYPVEAVQVTLNNVVGSMPDELSVIWYYGGPSVGWKFFKPGWGTDNTLTTMVPGRIYVGIVTTATEWEIPQ